ncbi:MAG: hypothetical protein GY820_38970 [Gammaproteobacteria bacterium]|nr:hypothetical protein [Gammaproteobacteria bacterium]
MDSQVAEANSTVEISTNERFDKLTNLDISTHYRDREYWFMKSDFLAAFSYWVVAQSPYSTPDIGPALKAFEKYVDVFLIPKDRHLPHRFTYEGLSESLTEEAFETIPEILALNSPKIGTGGKHIFVDRYSTPDPDHDFIDLGALSRNIFYMLLRENITQSCEH